MPVHTCQQIQRVPFSCFPGHARHDDRQRDHDDQRGPEECCDDIPQVDVMISDDDALGTTVDPAHDGPHSDHRLVVQVQVAEIEHQKCPRPPHFLTVNALGPLLPGGHDAWF